MKTYHVALLVIILLLSLLVRLYFVQNGEFLPLKDYDGRTYDGLARQLLAGKGFGNEGAKAFVTPGYPLFLSLIYRLTGTGEERIFVIRLVQAVLGTVTVLIVYGLGNKLGSPATGLLAAALAGIYPPLIWINGMILTEGLFTFLLTLYLFTALQALGNKRRGLSFLSGAVLGMASLVRPSAALFPLAVLGYFLVDPQVPRKEILKKTALTLLAMALVMSPWWVRNYREFHRFVPFSTESGWIFLQGTYPYQEFGKHHREIRASWPVGRDELETNELRFALGMKRAAAWLKNDFSSFWRHYLIEKPKHLWNYTYTGTFGRIPREDIDKFHRWLLRLALAGILLSMFLGPRLYSGPLAMVLLYFTAVHAVFLAIPRFALPATPVIFVFAAYLAVKAIGFLTGLPKRAMGF